jgi:hypothetical protein
MELEYHLHRLCKPWSKGKSPQNQLLHQEKLDLLLVQLHLRNFKFWTVRILYMK